VVVTVYLIDPFVVLRLPGVTVNESASSVDLV
jgi:hypothetical protein